ncbi:unnamed protein product [Ceutorhynchus assimilis]|uniref:HTH marR-type domain-containing protein n=1 Tax=Ceutorhynchus assimilis TaxID=467358 RepID=A0A9N9QEX8_9CUCU|nr:unnamed protein product [Ceutorhynchus assimilis]
MSMGSRYELELVAKFRETESVLGKKNVRPAVVNNEVMQVAVLGQLHARPGMSVRQLAAGTGLSKSSVHRILKLHKFYHYKLHLAQELNEDDYDRRIQIL